LKKVLTTWRNTVRFAADCETAGAYTTLRPIDARRQTMPLASRRPSIDRIAELLGASGIDSQISAAVAWPRL
jgi:hypothetical protein